MWFRTRPSRPCATFDLPPIVPLLGLLSVLGAATLLAGPSGYTLETSFPIGTQIKGLLIDDDHDLVVYDVETNATSTITIHFVEVNQPADGLFTFGFGIPSEPFFWTDLKPDTAFMAHDRERGLTYVLSKRDRTTIGGSTWYRMTIVVLDRSLGFTQKTFIHYNDTVDLQGGSPPDPPYSGQPLAPRDFLYEVTGFVLEEAGAEEGGNTRIVVDDNVKGNVDVLDFDQTGKALAGQSRISYRASLCQPGTFCEYFGIFGNSLALEPRIDFCAFALGTCDPWLSSLVDRLYVADKNFGEEMGVPIKSRFHILDLTPGTPAGATVRTPYDIADIDPFLGNGLNGLVLAPRSDTLYAFTGFQSFDDGWIGIYNTQGAATELLQPIHADLYTLAVDPANDRRVFVPTADTRPSNPTPTLFVRVYEDSTATPLPDPVLVDSITVVTGTDRREFGGIVFDPEYGLLYVAQKDTVYVYRGEPSGSLMPFHDGFESGDTSNWSGSAP